MSALASLLLVSTLSRIYVIEPSPTAEEVSVQPSEVRYIETQRQETILRQRPWVPNRRIATLGRGTRLVVRGQVQSRDEAGCNNEIWYAIAPYGFVCSRDVKVSSKPPSSRDSLAVRKGKRLPHEYVTVKAHDTPVYASLADVRAGITDQLLRKRMTLVVDKTVDIDGVNWVRSKSGKYVRRDYVIWGGQGSKWTGVLIEGEYRGLSFGWVTKDKSPYFASPGGKRLGVLKRRTRIPLFEEKTVGKTRYVQTSHGHWLMAKHVNEVRLIAPPEGVLNAKSAPFGQNQWFDVDTGEQVLVAYRGYKPVFATLISSGRSHPTPLGNYPVWAKVGSMTMANQEYDDKPYMIQGVPWVLLFQGHNAFHGAYWHDQFGIRKSHGCVNLAPRDARFVFEWAGMRLLEGWTGYLPTFLDSSPMIHVRNSKSHLSFTQERPVGPPNPEEEREKTKEAELRRAEEEAAKLAEEQAALAEQGIAVPDPAKLKVPTGVPKNLPNIRARLGMGEAPKPGGGSAPQASPKKQNGG